MAKETWQKIIDPGNLIWKDEFDPTSAEFQRRARALEPGETYADEQAALAASRQVGSQQAALASALRAQAEGRGPSLAQMQYQQALEASQAAAASQMASARGLSPAQAQQLLLTQQAGQRAGAAAQSAQLRLQEQQAAQAALGNILVQQRQQELLGGQLAAGVGTSQAQMQQRAKEMAMGYGAQQQAGQQKESGAILGAIGTGVGAYFGGPAGAAVGGKIGQEVASQQARGGDRAIVPGKAKFKGDTRSNDTVPALLSPGEIVLPRSVAQDEDAPEKAKKFVEAIKKQKRPSPKAFVEALARIKDLESRLDAMEALADLEAEQEG